MSDPRAPGPIYGLPMNYEAPLHAWDEVLAALGAMARSEVPVVVEVCYESWDRCGEFRGVLEALPPSTEGSRVSKDVFQVGKHVGWGARGEGGASYLELDRQRFNEGHLQTYDGDDYFYLTLDMGDVKVRIKDTNSH